MRRVSWLAVIAIAQWIAGRPAIGQTKKQASTPQEPTSGKGDETTYLQRGTKDAPLFIHIDQDPQGKIEAADTKKDAQSKDFYDKLTAGSAAVAALFTLALAIIGFWGVWVARNGVRVARETLTAIQGQLTEIQNAGAQTVMMLKHASTQAQAASDSVHISELAMITTVRPYVHHDGCQWISHQGQHSGLIWRIHPRWINAGNSPTRRLRIFIKYELMDNPLPRDFGFTYVAEEIMPVSTLGAKQTITSQHYDLSDDDLVAISEGRKHFYVWGVARYRDTFATTPERVTKFCSYILTVTGNPRHIFDGRINPVGLSFATYECHNCCDEECEVDATKSKQKAN